MLRSDEKNSNKNIIPVSLFSPCRAINPILDILKVPLNPMAHEEALRWGTCKIEESKSGIDLMSLHASGDRPGNGFGSAQFRRLIMRSIELGCPGKITLLASTTYGSPHLFYLYMGMIPIAKKVSYLKYYYGQNGINCLKNLDQDEEWSTQMLEELDKRTLNTLQRILHNEQKIDVEKEPISLDYIITQKDFIFGLKKKTLDYVSKVFIPDLLEALAEDPTNKYPNTKLLGAVDMQMSEKAFARWQYVIDNQLEFIPFKNLEHLDLTVEQHKQLADILNKRASALSHKLVQ